MRTVPPGDLPSAIDDRTTAVGWLPVDATRFDVLAVSAYKWLMCPRGTAFGYVSPSVRDRIRPVAANWYAGEGNASYGPPLRLAADARRFYIAVPWFSYVAAAPTLELLLDIGIGQIHEHDVCLANRFREGLGLPPLHHPRRRGRRPHRPWTVRDLFMDTMVDLCPPGRLEAALTTELVGTMRPADADGFREAWGIIERLWEQTVSRARILPAPELHERVDGEWSFIETLRHLVFITDAWVLRAILMDPSPWDPLDLPHTERPDEPGVPRDLDAQPSLEEMLELRADRMATVTQILAELDDEELAGLIEPSYPGQMSMSVRSCLQIVLNEEWAHRLYAERDLEALASR